MKFCVVFGCHPDDRPGGAELQAKFITEELADRGHDVHYIAYDSGTEDRREKNGVTIHRMRTSSLGGTYRSVLTRLTEIDPDFCYCRNIADTTLLSCIHALTETTTIFNISHDAQCRPMFASWPGAHNATPLHLAYRRSKLAVRRKLLTVPDIIFSQTRHQAQTLRENRDLRSHVVGNGHPVPQSLPEKSDPPVVLWLASIKKWKQPTVFVELAEQCTDLDCEFKIVGQPTNPELAQKIRDFTSDRSNIDYCGGCGVAESNDYIADATVFINTSQQEGFPNTFLQSWLRKTAVASLHVDPEQLLSETGLGHYAGGDREELISSVRQLLTHEQERAALCEQARDYAIENFSIESVVDRIEEAIRTEGYRLG